MTDLQFHNMHDQIKDVADRCGERAAYKWFLRDGQIDSISWQAYYEKLKKAAKSLLTLGIEKGDKINIISNTRFEWVLCDHANICIGGATAGIYQSNLAEDCLYIIDHSDAKIVFVEDEEQLEKVLSIRDKIPEITKVILISGQCPADDWVMDFNRFLELGSNVSDADFLSRVNSIEADNTAGIVYTSGTTGVPKGAVVTYANLYFTAYGVKKSVGFEDDEETFLFLPLAHSYARILVHSALAEGHTLTFFRSMDTLVADFQVVRPHYFSSVPRIYEKIYSAVVSGAESKGGMVLKLFKWSVAVGERVADLKEAGKPIPALLALKYNMATKLVFSKVQAALGGRVTRCISGAAPLTPSIIKFFHAAGIKVLEGMGMTENMAVSHVNRPQKFKFGYVGMPIAGVEHKIAGDGEILIKGPNVMNGYYKMPDKTAETIVDGWLHSGDLGEIDADNFCRITGRKKDLIITAGGKNIAPSRIEGIMGTSKYINQISVIGDRRKFLSAIITVDNENVEAYARQNSIQFNRVEDLINNDQILDLLRCEVDLKNRELGSFEQIKKFILAPEFTIENNQITPTLKIKKNVVEEVFQKELDRLYA